MSNSIDIKTSVIFLESLFRTYNIDTQLYDDYINNECETLSNRYPKLFELCTSADIDIVPYQFAWQFFNGQKNLIHIFKQNLDEIGKWQDDYENKCVFDIASKNMYELFLVIGFIQQIL